MAENELENRSFGELFGGKQRIIIPFGKGKIEGTMGEIIQFFEENGYEIDVVRGTATKEAKTQKGTQKREVRIGKLLQLFKDLQSEWSKPSGNPIKIWKIIIEKFPLSKRTFENTTDETSFPIIPGFEFNDKEYLTDDLAEWADFWNSKSEYYRKNPQEMKKIPSEYSIIVSRAPIDVLRMSDF